MYGIHDLYIFLTTLSIALAVTLKPASKSFAFCVNSSLEITCTTTTSTVRWDIIIPTQGNSSSERTKVYTSSSSLEDVEMFGDLVLRLESKYPFVSTATLDEIDPTNNGTVLTCANTPLEFPKDDEIAKITVIVNGKLYIRNIILLCMLYYYDERKMSVSKF